MYHGSPYFGLSDDFSNFVSRKKILYFTEDYQVAKEYALLDPAGSVVFAAAQGPDGVENSPTIYEVNVFPSNVFDLRNVDAQSIYNKLRNKSKLEADPEDWLPLLNKRAPNGLLSWPVETMIKKDLIRLGFDSMWIDEGSQGISLALFDHKDKVTVVNTERLMKRNPVRLKKHPDLFKASDGSYLKSKDTYMSLHEDEEDYEEVIDEQKGEVVEALTKIINSRYLHSEYNFEESIHWDEFEYSLPDAYYRKDLLGEIQEIEWNDVEKGELIDKYMTEVYTDAELIDLLNHLPLYNGRLVNRHKEDLPTGEHKIRGIPLQNDSIWFDRAHILEELMDEIDVEAEYLEQYIDDEDVWEEAVTNTHYEPNYEIEWREKDDRGGDIKKFESVSFEILAPDDSYYVIAIDEDYWYDRLSDRELPEEPVKESQIVYRFGNGSYVAQLNPRNLHDEANRLGHCVGRSEYVEAVLNDTMRIFSVRTQTGKSRFTIEFNVEDQTIDQVKGKGNRLPGFSLELERAYNEIARDFNLSNSDFANRGLLVSQSAERKLRERVLHKFKAYEAYQVAEFIYIYFGSGSTFEGTQEEWSDLMDVDDLFPAIMLITLFDLEKPRTNPGYYYE